MNADLGLKAGDTARSFERTLERDGEAIDLTNADSVQFSMQQYDGETSVSGTATIQSAVDGAVSYSWSSGETDDPGLYFAEWTITWGDGSEEGVPKREYDTVLISSDV